MKRHAESIAEPDADPMSRVLAFVSEPACLSRLASGFPDVGVRRIARRT